MNADTGSTVTASVNQGRPAKLSARGIAKRYGMVDALLPIDLDVAPGEFLTVLGPSGSGKTTLLQLIAGLIEPSAGALFIDGRDETHTPAHKRGVGVVFQSYALFPHMTVRENVCFPLQMRHIPRAELQRRVAATLEMVGLGALQDRFPGELSGGQQQRVALARCFVYQPALILMDEPLGALDRKLRETMQIEIKRLHRDTGATIIFVTHDQDEALALSDRICLMNHGRIEQLGEPQDIYERPKTLFAADFIGISNVMRGRVGPGGMLETADGALPLPAGAPCPAAGQTAALVIRPEHIELLPPDGTALRGRISESVYAGSEFRLLVTLDSGTTLVARRSPGHAELRIGDEVALGWAADRARLLPA
ncbi:putative spermidine/putrescine transport system ATP-binding protein [Humitalea rosea]|uniref:Putative spermidine/putrescine transport system ATP-binding protein n=1 Tax=Humitalea rosea TaxID=990373 RepID=A0A2W7IWB1_9PROT|nr:ABC transporter ATP-binding protein [Humitalea rosea]PZW42983.1 putative spermidine/putrescine transport system ATP-binding protein [Humitalea rosea]